MHNIILEKINRQLNKSCRSFVLFLALVVFWVAVPKVYGQVDVAESLNFKGDFRVRYERTTKQEAGNVPDVISEPRNREVVRLRLGINKKINGLFNFGARLTTGSPDDPNTTDVTVGDFVNDLSVSLDRAYMELRYQNLFVTAGKFINPFLTTELVWDGDVNPQGLAASYSFKANETVAPKLIGVYSIVDEQTTNPDSYMLGGQLQLAIKPSQDWNLTLSGAFYDYKIQALTNADAGDTRSNYLMNNGTEYLSDFNLIDFIARVDYSGLNEQFPIRFVGNYVKNNGAEVDEDTGFKLDLYVGKMSQKQDLRFLYGYSKVETDAVLAAFTNDNTTIATNYEQHTFAVDYVVVDDTILNLTMYLYRADKFDPLPGLDNEFFTRLRLNALVNF